LEGRSLPTLDLSFSQLSWEKALIPPQYPSPRLHPVTDGTIFLSRTKIRFRELIN